MKEDKINVGPDIKKAKHKYLLGILVLYNLPMMYMIFGWEDFRGGKSVVDIILIYGNLVIVVGYFLIYFVSKFSSKFLKSSFKPKDPKNNNGF